MNDCGFPFTASSRSCAVWTSPSVLLPAAASAARTAFRYRSKSRFEACEVRGAMGYDQAGAARLVARRLSRSLAPPLPESPPCHPSFSQGASGKCEPVVGAHAAFEREFAASALTLASHLSAPRRPLLMRLDHARGRRDDDPQRTLARVNAVLADGESPRGFARHSALPTINAKIFCTDSRPGCAKYSHIAVEDLNITVFRA